LVSWAALPPFPRTLFAALAGALALGACSLLAPGDEELLGGTDTKDGAPDRPDRQNDAEPDISQDGATSDGADVSSPADAATDDGQTDGGADAAHDADDASPADATDAAPRCSDAADCVPGSFCNLLGRCRSCSDPATLRNLQELEYGPPEPLTAVNDAAQGVHLRYPRAFDAKTKLLYERDLFGAQIWLTADMTQTPGAPLTYPIDVPGATEATALKFAPGVGPLAGFNFFYFAEVNRGDERSPFELFGATIDDFGYAPAVTRLPAPFNAAPTAGRWNFSLALSETRAIWASSDGGLLVQLMTASLGETTTTVLQLPDANGCRPNQLEWGPWLAPSGRILFFNAVERAVDCQLTSQFPRDIYVVELDESGHPAGPATPLRGVSRPGSTEVDGSLSDDQCWLFYSKETPAGLRLFRSRRVR
jgi:hypothetical protein